MVCKGRKVHLPSDHTTTSQMSKKLLAMDVAFFLSMKAQWHVPSPCVPHHYWEGTNQSHISTMPHVSRAAGYVPTILPSTSTAPVTT